MTGYDKENRFHFSFNMVKFNSGCSSRKKDRLQVHAKITLTIYGLKDVTTILMIIKACNKEYECCACSDH